MIRTDIMYFVSGSLIVLLFFFVCTAIYVTQKKETMAKFFSGIAVLMLALLQISLVIGGATDGEGAPMKMSRLAPGTYQVIGSNYADLPPEKHIDPTAHKVIIVQNLENEAQIPAYIRYDERLLACFMKASSGTITDVFCPK